MFVMNNCKLQCLGHVLNTCLLQCLMYMMNTCLLHCLMYDEKLGAAPLGPFNRTETIHFLARAWLASFFSPCVYCLYHVQAQWTHGVWSGQHVATCSLLKATAVFQTIQKSTANTKAECALQTTSQTGNKSQTMISSSQTTSSNYQKKLKQWLKFNTHLPIIRKSQNNDWSLTHILPIVRKIKTIFNRYKRTLLFSVLTLFT